MAKTNRRNGDSQNQLDDIRLDEIPCEGRSQPNPEAGSGVASFNPFDPALLRLGQDFSESAGVERVLTTVPCRKPNRQEFIRVRPGEDWQLSTRLLEDARNQDKYLVSQELWPHLRSEIHPTHLFLAINRQDDVFLWPVKLAGIDGRPNPWNQSALAAARLAEKSWIRIASNHNAGRYDVHRAKSDLPDPVWPNVDFTEILRLCFQDRFINDLDHPLLQELRGER